jgi:hypothetical protein
MTSGTNSKMKFLIGAVWTALLGLLLLAGSVSNSSAEDVEAAGGVDSAEVDVEKKENDRLAEIEEKVEILTDEVGRLESIFAVPEDVALESFSGLGPAASNSRPPLRVPILERRSSCMCHETGRPRSRILALGIAFRTGYTEWPERTRRTPRND